MLLSSWDADWECQEIHFSLAMESEIVATKVKPERGGGRSQREVTQKTCNPHKQRAEQKTWGAPPVFQKLSYLLVRVRPVKAQEKVGGLTMQKEISCPEWDGKALNSVAEVKRDPEVLSISIRKDVLQEKRDELRAWPDQRNPTPPKQCLSTHKCRGQPAPTQCQGLAGLPHGIVTVSWQWRDAGAH